jgi:hypothetical protein
MLKIIWDLVCVILRTLCVKGGDWDVLFFDNHKLVVNLI